MPSFLTTWRWYLGPLTPYILSSLPRMRHGLLTCIRGTWQGRAAPVSQEGTEPKSTSVLVEKFHTKPASAPCPYKDQKGFPPGHSPTHAVAPPRESILHPSQQVMPQGPSLPSWGSLALDPTGPHANMSLCRVTFHRAQCHPKETHEGEAKKVKVCILHYHEPLWTNSSLLQAASMNI